jgi:Flp pilus assembly protein CpaB
MTATVGLERGPEIDGLGPDPDTGPPRLRRRRTLPGSRSVVGAFLVAIAVVGVFAASTGTGGDADRRYVVARHQVAAGTLLAATDLALMPMRLPAPLASARVFSDPDQLVGSIAVGPIGPGELVQASDVLRKAGGPRSREISVPIEVSRAVAGTLRPGDRVDIAATFASGAEAYSLFVIRGAEVLSRSDSGGALDNGGKEILTLSVTSAADALALAHAISAGQLTVVRATGADPAGTEPYRAPSSQRSDGQ